MAGSRVVVLVTSCPLLPRFGVTLNVQAAPVSSGLVPEIVPQPVVLKS